MRLTIRCDNRSNEEPLSEDALEVIRDWQCIMLALNETTNRFLDLGSIVMR